MIENPSISIVVPCYNEEGVINIFLEHIEPILVGLNKNYEIVFVNDGSEDNTFEVMLNAKNSHKNIRVLNLSRNFGKEAALTAGLEHAKGDAVIPIDVDLQDPPELIISFIEKWEEGFDVVLAKRVDRTSDSFVKRVSAEYFYKIHNKISDISIPSNVGDYRLMSRRVIESLKMLPENQRFMKGLFAWAGYKTTYVEYTREVRVAGHSSFNGWKLWNFALDGITSFSTAPLRVWLYVGVVISFLAFLFGCTIIIKTLIFGIDLPGYASLTTIVLFLGGIQLMGIGILGEYIGRIYKESKRRPTYIIENEY
jgi:glycosyltransferase involved in cell wall biosynthesis